MTKSTHTHNHTRSVIKKKSWVALENTETTLYQSEQYKKYTHFFAVVCIENG